MLKKVQNLLASTMAFLGMRASGLPIYPADSLINPFPNGRYKFFGRTNGASRRRKTNRLHLSTKTRNKHR